MWLAMSPGLHCPSPNQNHDVVGQDRSVVAIEWECMDKIQLVNTDQCLLVPSRIETGHGVLSL